MKKMIRIKKEGVTVLEIVPTEITAFQISDDEEGTYYLSIFTLGVEYIVLAGTFDQCHAKLNDLHIAIPCDITDV